MPKSKENARKTRDVDFVAKGQEMIDEDSIKLFINSLIHNLDFI